MLNAIPLSRFDQALEELGLLDRWGSVTRMTHLKFSPGVVEATLLDPEVNPSLRTAYEVAHLVDWGHEDYLAAIKKMWGGDINRLQSITLCRGYYRVELFANFRDLDGNRVIESRCGKVLIPGRE